MEHSLIEARTQYLGPFRKVVGDMFRILERARYGGSQVRWGYGGESVSFDPNEPVRPLDPIDPNLVGKAQVTAALRWARRESYGILSEILEVIADRPPDWIDRIQQNRRTAPYIGDRYREHLEELCRVGLIEKVRAKPTFLSSYFAVPKGDSHSRSIFNGKKLSEAGQPPPPVNLLSSHELLKAII